MRNYVIALLFLSILLIGSCDKEKKVELPTSKGVYISNEGNFTFGNAEITFYDPANNNVTNNLFSAANGYSLGDVAQSICIKDSFAFVVVNNSQKIEMVQLPSFKKVRTITIAGSSPRYFLPVNDSIAYISELYAGQVYVVNYQTGVVVKGIVMPSTWSERMIFNGTDVLVETLEQLGSATHNSGVTVINSVTHTVVNSYKLNGANTFGLAKDKYGKIWVAKDEDTTIQQTAMFYVLNSSYATTDSFMFSTNHHPTNICMNKAGDRIYFLDKDVYSLSVEQDSVPQLLIAAGGKNLYGLALDPVTDEIYVSDAVDFVQKSGIYRYDKNGQLIYSFTAGVISGNFAFTHD